MNLIIEGNPRLQALIEGDPSCPCAIVTHPHPLYGGDMHNNVVRAARAAALEAGLSCLRFNFRGTGLSAGCFDEGQGEINDLERAVKSVSCPAVIIGYSFGAYVAANYLQSADLPAILIAPPTGLMQHPSLKGRNVWLIAGAQDEFCDLEALDEMTDLNRIITQNGIDHFWFGAEEMIGRIVAGLLIDIKASRPA
jgi:hypothetical protein